MCDKLKGGHPIILSVKEREAYIKKLAKQYSDWHKIGALSPYTIPIAEQKQRKRETKIDPGVVTFLKNNDAYDEAIFNWSNWSKFVRDALHALKKPNKTRTRHTSPSKNMQIRRTTKPKTRIVEKNVFKNKHLPYGLSSARDSEWLTHLEDAGMDPARIKLLSELRKEIRKENGIK